MQVPRSKDIAPAHFGAHRGAPPPPSNCQRSGRFSLPLGRIRWRRRRRPPIGFPKHPRDIQVAEQNVIPHGPTPPKNYASTSWLRTAYRTRSLTQWQLSLRMRFVRCASTVLALRPSRTATSLLILPSANNCRTSLSLAVST